MLYDSSNSDPAMVFDVEARSQMHLVMSVDTDSGVVTLASVDSAMRFRKAGDEIETFEARLQSIYPIFGGRTTPVLFHCYGRIQ